ncbi:MAG: spore maturation protein [Clostridia bacterium]|jgi:spore maturation protein A|nr:spore maturation protein [Clostridia bacterium]
MVNLVWLFLLLSGIVVAGINGNINIVTTAALSSAQRAVTIALELIGIMALWLGLLKIAEEAGMVRLLARIMRPFTSFLFPSVPKDHPVMGAILMNLSANILGLGNAATPFGLKTMQGLQSLNSNPDEASDAMCTFLALNTSCITLIPATIIGVRAAAGSQNPSEIVGATIFATGVAMTVAIVADRLLRARFGRDSRR